MIHKKIRRPFDSIVQKFQPTLEKTKTLLAKKFYGNCLFEHRIEFTRKIFPQKFCMRLCFKLSTITITKRLMIDVCCNTLSFRERNTMAQLFVSVEFFAQLSCACLFDLEKATKRINKTNENK